MKAWRYGLGATGLLLLLFGVVRLLIAVPGKLPGLALWLVGIAVIHDAVLAPLVVGIGWLLGRVVPPRPRRYLQAALITGGLITIVAIPLIIREGTQPSSKAWLLQNYSGNLAVLIGFVVAVNVLAYALALGRDRRVSAGPQPE